MRKKPKGGLTMLDQQDVAKIEKNMDDLKQVHKAFTSRESACYDHYVKLLGHAMKEKSLTRAAKELVGVGIAAYAYCEPCLTWHIREALKAGATDDQVVEAVEVAIEMGGGTVVARGAAYAFKVLEYYRERGGVRKG
jgi:AhpD family alkylhydroperoxidase